MKIILPMALHPCTLAILHIRIEQNFFKVCILASRVGPGVSTFLVVVVVFVVVVAVVVGASVVGSAVVSAIAVVSGSGIFLGGGLKKFQDRLTLGGAFKEVMCY